jgi:hypothetical protein
MAEQEVIKHTKKVFSIWSDKEHSFWHKLKEFLIEVAIIVFAVTLSIWLHGRSEHRHQQDEVKEFLLGLREDLKNDIQEMTGDKASYEKQGHAFTYITGVKMHETLNLDSLKKYQNYVFNSTGLIQNSGRFEGFKSSGKIGTIEDKKLQNDIMDLYQENIPSLLTATNSYVSRKNNFFNYVNKNRKRTSDSTTNMPVVLLGDEAQNLCISLAGVGEIIDRYDSCINKMNMINGQIDSIYRLKE